jgi:hypothetical protein
MLPEESTYAPVSYMWEPSTIENVNKCRIETLDLVYIPWLQ